MNYPPRRPITQRILSASLWLVGDALMSLARLTHRWSASLKDASDSVACYEFTTRSR